MAVCATCRGVGRVAVYNGPHRVLFKPCGGCQGTGVVDDSPADT